MSSNQICTLISENWKIEILKTCVFQPLDELISGIWSCCPGSVWIVNSQLLMCRTGHRTKNHHKLRIISCLKRGDGVSLSLAQTQSTEDDFQHWLWPFYCQINQKIPPRDRVVPQPPSKDMGMLTETGVTYKARHWDGRTWWCLQMYEVFSCCHNGFGGGEEAPVCHPEAQGWLSCRAQCPYGIALLTGIAATWCQGSQCAS